MRATERMHERMRAKTSFTMSNSPENLANAALVPGGDLSPFGARGCATLLLPQKRERSAEKALGAERRTMRVCETRVGRLRGVPRPLRSGRSPLGAPPRPFDSCRVVVPGRSPECGLPIRPREPLPPPPFGCLRKTPRRRGEIHFTYARAHSRVKKIGVIHRRDGEYHCAVRAACSRCRRENTYFAGWVR
jgi:hypothetical protein